MPNMQLKRRHIRALERRAAFLKERIDASVKDLTYDKQEMASLNIAISIMNRIIDDPRLWGDFYGEERDI